MLEQFKSLWRTIRMCARVYWFESDLKRVSLKQIGSVVFRRCLICGVRRLSLN